MRVIAVDIGNSSAKFAIANNRDGELAEVHSIENGHRFQAALFDWFDWHAQYRWMVCSVHAARAQELKEWLDRERKQDRFHLIQSSEIPLLSDVQSRETLGRDRLLAAWQARQMFPQGRLITIDAGTAVTVDLVTSASVFVGGVIFPGARTMLRMLAQQTAALPDLANIGIHGAFEGELDFEKNSHDEFPVVGKSTRQAILMGVYQTQISTLRSVVTSIKFQSADPPTVVTTGGGIRELRPWLPQEWIYDPLLLLRGASSLAQVLTVEGA